MTPFEQENELELRDRRRSAAGLGALPGDHARVQSDFMNRVYRFMAIGLGMSGATAMLIAGSPTAAQAARDYMWPLFIGQLVLVFALSRFAEKMTAATASGLFILYSVLSGVTLSFIFMVYTQGSIASTFFVTAGTFGAMSLYGARTTRDLTSMGAFMRMGLFGLIIASVVNIFVGSTMLYWLTTYAGVLIFVGLTAYDTQKILRMSQVARSEEERNKLAVNGALILYLDFVNLFLMLLRLFGRRR